MATKKAPAKAAQAESAEIRFGKDQILTFKQYATRVDLLKALLKDGKKYTTDEVDTIIEKWKGKVV